MSTGPSLPTRPCLYREDSDTKSLGCNSSFNRILKISQDPSSKHPLRGCSEALSAAALRLQLQHQQLESAGTVQPVESNTALQLMPHCCITESSMQGT
jgi:hypothetical protein